MYIWRWLHEREQCNTMDKSILKMGTETLPINSVFVACVNFSCWEKEGKIGELTRGNWHTTVRAMAAETGIGHHVVQEMVESLRYWKVFACCVPHSLTWSSKFSQKIFPHDWCSGMLSEAMTFFTAWWKVTEAGHTLSCYRLWNGIRRHDPRKRSQKECPHRISLCKLSRSLSCTALKCPWNK